MCSEHILWMCNLSACSRNWHFILSFSFLILNYFNFVLTYLILKISTPIFGLLLVFWAGFKWSGYCFVCGWNLANSTWFSRNKVRSKSVWPQSHAATQFSSKECVGYLEQVVTAVLATQRALSHLSCLLRICLHSIGISNIFFTGTGSVKKRKENGQHIQPEYKTRNFCDLC